MLMPNAFCCKCSKMYLQKHILKHLQVCGSINGEESDERESAFGEKGKRVGKGWTSKFSIRTCMVSAAHDQHSNGDLCFSCAYISI